MKMIGVIGGMSAASTQIYYRKMCDLARQRLGGLHSPELNRAGIAGGSPS